MQFPSGPISDLARHQGKLHTIGARHPAAAGQRDEELTKAGNVRSDLTTGLEIDGVDVRCPRSRGQRQGSSAGCLKLPDRSSTLG
jgi:hypothetical protein